MCGGVGSGFISGTYVRVLLQLHITCMSEVLKYLELVTTYRYCTEQLMMFVKLL